MSSKFNQNNRIMPIKSDRREKTRKAKEVKKKEWTVQMLQAYHRPRTFAQRWVWLLVTSVLMLILVHIFSGFLAYNSTFGFLSGLVPVAVAAAATLSAVGLLQFFMAFLFHNFWREYFEDGLNGWLLAGCLLCIVGSGWIDYKGGETVVWENSKMTELETEEDVTEFYDRQIAVTDSELKKSRNNKNSEGITFVSESANIKTLTLQKNNLLNARQSALDSLRATNRALTVNFNKETTLSATETGWAGVGGMLLSFLFCFLIAWYFDEAAEDYDANETGAKTDIETPALTEKTLVKMIDAVRSKQATEQESVTDKSIQNTLQSIASKQVNGHEPAQNSAGVLIKGFSGTKQAQSPVEQIVAAGTKKPGTIVKTVYESPEVIDVSKARGQINTYWHRTKKENPTAKVLNKFQAFKTTLENNGYRVEESNNKLVITDPIKT